MAATMGSPERLLTMTTLKRMENREDFLCNFTLLLVLVVTAPQAAQGSPWPWCQVAFADLTIKPRLCLVTKRRSSLGGGVIAVVWLGLRWCP